MNEIIVKLQHALSKVSAIQTELADLKRDIIDALDLIDVLLGADGNSPPADQDGNSPPAEEDGNSPPAEATYPTITPGSGELTDAAGNKFSVTEGGQIVRNGDLDETTQGVLEMFLVEGVAYQRIGATEIFPDGGIWGWTGTWGARLTTDPRNAGEDPPADTTQPPASMRGLLPGLARGVNLEVGGAFRNSDDKTSAVWDDTSESELAALAASGVTAIRIRGNSSWFGMPITAGAIDVKNSGLNALLAFCKRINAAGMTAMIHPINEDADKNTNHISTQDAKNAVKVAADFKTLAAYIKAQGFAPEDLIIGTRNEPTVNAAVWKGIERQYIDAIRAGWAESFISYSSTDWSSIKQAVTVTPHLAADGKTPLERMILEVHDYAAMGFTHQDLNWMEGDAFHKDLPHHYPGYGGYTAEAMAAAYDALAAYLDKWGIPASITEFGVGDNAPDADRWAWIKDVRSNAERIGVGFAYFSWNKGFGQLIGTKGSRETDPRLKAALGLS